MSPFEERVVVWGHGESPAYKGIPVTDRVQVFRRRFLSDFGPIFPLRIVPLYKYIYY